MAPRSVLPPRKEFHQSVQDQLLISHFECFAFKPRSIQSIVAKEKGCYTEVMCMAFLAKRALFTLLINVHGQPPSPLITGAFLKDHANAWLSLSLTTWCTHLLCPACKIHPSSFIRDGQFDFISPFKKALGHSTRCLWLFSSKLSLPRKMNLWFSRNCWIIISVILDQGPCWLEMLRVKSLEEQRSTC